MRSISPSLAGKKSFQASLSFLKHTSTASASASTSTQTSTPQRFWKTVSVTESPPSLSSSPSSLEIHLDNRPLKTLNGNKILIPCTHGLLASLAAREWDGQTNLVRTHALPLTSLLSRSLDSLSLPEERQALRRELLAFLDTDTACFHQEAPWQLVQRQKDHWDPLLDWVRQKYGVQVNVYTGLFERGQPEETKRALDAVVARYSAIQLAAFERAVRYSKSYIIALALTEGRITVEQAADASSVETLSQVDKWGLVEDSHDVQHQEARLMLGSCAVAMHKS